MECDIIGPLPMRDCRISALGRPRWFPGDVSRLDSEEKFPKYLQDNDRGQVELKYDRRRFMS